ncbi:hypothetical protein [Schleiferia thermophila]|uniref:hypothetical protein n=1 Tax=Schleiferia thermophila TaxID=884107 RepID=UPI003EE9FFE0
MWFVFLILSIFSIAYGFWNLFNSLSGFLSRWQIKPVIAGFIVFSAITSLPEVFAAAYSLNRQYTLVPLPMVMGSNLFNYTVLLAVVVVLKRVRINATARDEDFWAEILISIVLFFNFLETPAIHSLSLLSVVLLFIVYGFLVRKIKLRNREKMAFSSMELPRQHHWWFLFAKGLVFTIAGAILLVEGSLSLSAVTGITSMVWSYAVNGAIVSIPEILLLIYLINDNQISASLSTIAGSGVFNWVMGFAVPQYFSGLVLDETLHVRSLFGIYYATIFIVFLWLRYKGNKELKKTEAIALISLFCLSVLAVFLEVNFCQNG